MTYVYWQLIYLPLILLAMYAAYIQHNRGGMWRALELIGLVATPLDIYLNYTTFTFYFWERPANKAYTFSKQIALLQYDTGWRGVIARGVKRLLNAIDPKHNHIP